MEDQLNKVLASEGGWEKLNDLNKVTLDEIRLHERFTLRAIYTLAILFGFVVLVIKTPVLDVRLFGLKVAPPSLVAYLVLPVIAATYYLLISRTLQLNYATHIRENIFGLLYPEVLDEKVLVGFHPQYLVKAERILNRYFDDATSCIYINTVLAILALLVYAGPIVALIAAFVINFWKYGSVGPLTWVSLVLSLLFVGQTVALLVYGAKLSKNMPNRNQHDPEGRVYPN